MLAELARALTLTRIGVARRQARAPITEAAVEPGEDAAEIAARVGGIAVAVDLSPGADALRPEREVGRLGPRRARRGPYPERGVLVRVGPSGVRFGLPLMPPC